MASVNLDTTSRLDITCRRNDTFKLDMDWLDSENNPIDLTAYEFKAQVRKTSTSTAVILSFDNADFSKDNSGNLVMSKSAANMDVKGGSYAYDLQATKTATSEVHTWLGGDFIVVDDVTTG